MKLRTRILIFTIVALGVVPGSSAAAEAGFFADDPIGWHNSADYQRSDASIPARGSVIFENRDRDTVEGHSVQCVQDESNNACPWSDTLPLPRPPTATVTAVTVTYQAPGTYAFRCGVHPRQMRGRVVVGTGVPEPSPSPSPSPSPTPSRSPSPLPIPQSTNPAPEFVPPEGSESAAASSAQAASAAGKESGGFDSKVLVAAVAGLLLITAGGALVYLLKRRSAYDDRGQS